MIRECDMCGERMDDFWMDGYNTGRTNREGRPDFTTPGGIMEWWIYET